VPPNGCITSDAADDRSTRRAVADCPVVFDRGEELDAVRWTPAVATRPNRPFICACALDVPNATMTSKPPKTRPGLIMVESRGRMAVDAS
jgi:hypothetical protein